MANVMLAFLARVAIIALMTVVTLTTQLKKTPSVGQGYGPKTR